MQIHQGVEKRLLILNVNNMSSAMQFLVAIYLLIRNNFDLNN
jgi:hypothetical protein